MYASQRFVQWDLMHYTISHKIVIITTDSFLDWHLRPAILQILHIEQKTKHEHNQLQPVSR